LHKASNFSRIFGIATRCSFVLKPLQENGTVLGFTSMYLINDILKETLGTNSFGCIITEITRHWRWFVPHDIDGLVNLFGSTSNFISQLDEFFYRSEDDPLNALPNPYYWAGNEPDILAVWMFDWVGRPDLTQQYSRMVMTSKYTSQPDGLPGNDDYGTSTLGSKIILY
jgi:hypothetical protein